MSRDSRIIAAAGTVSVVLSVGFLTLIIYLMASLGRNAPQVHLLINIWTSLGFILIAVVYVSRKKQLSTNSDGLIRLKQGFRKLILIYSATYFFVLIASLWVLLR